MTRIILKPCPCGKTPESLSIEAGASCKWSYASGNCCGDWNIEFRTTYTNDDDELMRLAVDAWNNACREH